MFRKSTVVLALLAILPTLATAEECESTTNEDGREEFECRVDTGVGPIGDPTNPLLVPRHLDLESDQNLIVNICSRDTSGLWSLAPVKFAEYLAVSGGGNPGTLELWHHKIDGQDVVAAHWFTTNSPPSSAVVFAGQCRDSGAHLFVTIAAVVNGVDISENGELIGSFMFPNEGRNALANSAWFTVYRSAVSNGIVNSYSIRTMFRTFRRR